MSFVRRTRGIVVALGSAGRDRRARADVAQPDAGLRRGGLPRRRVALRPDVGGHRRRWRAGRARARFATTRHAKGKDGPPDAGAVLDRTDRGGPCAGLSRGRHHARAFGHALSDGRRTAQHDGADAGARPPTGGRACDLRDDVQLRVSRRRAGTRRTCGRRRSAHHHRRFGPGRIRGRGDCLGPWFLRRRRR